MKEFLIKHLTELVTDYVNTKWNDLYFNYINSEWDYVELKQLCDSDNISWDKYRSPLSAMYEHSFDWWEIIFQFTDDYYWVDIDEVQYYRSDYEDYLKDKDKYIKDKVDYIISLTW